MMPRKGTSRPNTTSITLLDLKDVDSLLGIELL